jgi:ABC-type antimicrobial peptide transport system permease subunit
MIRMVVRDGVTLALLGSLIGIPASLALSRVAESMVFGLEPSNPWIPLTAGVCSVIVGTASGLWPAMKAASVDPSTALRAE